MNEEAGRFLRELEIELGNSPHAEEILADYKMHVIEMLRDSESGNTKPLTYQEITERLGTPEELAAIWKEENSVTPKKMQRLFVFLNIALFLGGALLTLGYNVLEWQWLDELWRRLTELTTLIIFTYLFFWGLLGYEIGKAFGAKGKKIVNRTFLIAIIPNVILMYVIVFRLIPYSWFDPLLDRTFVLFSVLGTLSLYPICLLGYRWGRKKSV